LRNKAVEPGILEIHKRIVAAAMERKFSYFRIAECTRMKTGPLENGSIGGGWQGRAASEEPDCRGGQFRLPG